MNVYRLFVWAVVFGSLLTYVLVFERKERVRVPVAEPVRNTVTSLDAADVSAVRITRHGEAVLVRRGPDEGWKVIEPRGAGIKDTLVESLLDTLVTTVVIEIIAESPQDPAPFGLAEPAFQVTLTGKHEKVQETLLLGKTAPSGVSLYAQKAGEKSVLLLGTYIRFALNTFLDNVKQPGS